MKFSPTPKKSTTFHNSASDAVEPFVMDVKRMREAIKSESHDIPQGLSVEEIRQHILTNKSPRK